MLNHPPSSGYDHALNIKKHVDNAANGLRQRLQNGQLTAADGERLFEAVNRFANEDVFREFSPERISKMSI